MLGIVHLMAMVLEVGDGGIQILLDGDRFCLSAEGSFGLVFLQSSIEPLVENVFRAFAGFELCQLAISRCIDEPGTQVEYDRYKS
ncbi:MAG: hypothetical protein HC780_21260 [Leptolyngbyaceae cyanobacterium CSU_1_3]|nr:hypothetical protein [Leptolyngbyaceae cyanobacterium CSU_1_3]